MIKTLSSKNNQYFWNLFIQTKNNPLLTFNLYKNKSLSNIFNFQFTSYNKKSYESSNKKSYPTKSQKRKNYVPPIKIRPSMKQERQKKKEEQKFSELPVTDPQLLIDHINNKNSIQEAVKLLNRIINNQMITKQEFQQKAWKKYCYYIYIVGKKEEARWKGKQFIPKNAQINIHTNSQDLIQENEQQQQNSQLKQTLQPGSNAHQAQGNSNPQKQQNYFSNQYQKPMIMSLNNLKMKQIKDRRLNIQFVLLIAQIHNRFKGQLQSQNITKTFNKFIDHYINRQSWQLLTLKQKTSLLKGLSLFNIKKAKAMFFLKKDLIFNKIQNYQHQQPSFNSQDIINIFWIMNKLQINDTSLFQKCIDRLYQRIDSLKIQQLDYLAFSLGKSHKFVNKDFVQKLRDRLNQLINNQFNDMQMISALHIVSAFSLIQKNMGLASVYFEPLDQIYQRILPLFNSSMLKRMKSNHITSVASTLRRSKYFDPVILDGLVREFVKRQVLQFFRQKQFSPNNSQIKQNYYLRKSLSTITIPQLAQLFFTLARFNYRNVQFTQYFIDILKVVQQSKNPQQYISYPLFSRILWSICVICNDQQIQKLLPLMRHFYETVKEVQPYEATNFYYCYLLMKRKFFVTEIRFDNDKIKQYLDGPKHQIKISQTQKQIHKRLIDLGIPSIAQYNLNNVMCDIYIPKYMDIEHLIIEVHGFHHFCRNVKRLTGSTVLKQKIIQNQGYQCFYISLDEWQIAQDKNAFLKEFFEIILLKKHEEKQKKRQMSESLKLVQKNQNRGRKILQFKTVKTIG